MSQICFKHVPKMSQQGHRMIEHAPNIAQTWPNHVPKMFQIGPKHVLTKEGQELGFEVLKPKMTKDHDY